MASLVERAFQAKEVSIDSEISFGAWVTRQRKALDLTREQLARRVGCSVSGLRKIESDERRPSRQMAELLADCLQIPPDQRPTFLRVARGQLRAERLPAASHVLDRGLPSPPTPLIGREPELAALNRLLGDPHCRLLTLAGPGGIGKTRLALELASTQRAQFPDGVFFVPLVSLSSPEFIAPAIGSALGLSSSSLLDPKVQLLNHVRQKSLLLVLDNLEHLLEGVGLLAELLEQVPGVKLLVTSRERLNMQGEWLFDLQGLPVPPLDQMDRAEEYSAVALFFQSAQRAQVGFELRAEERPWAAHICQLVEGMPLAIELAAAWARLLSCREIVREIERNLDFLVTSARDLPERHRSMRAVFDSSWQMLSAEEQRILRALSVFRGGFLRETAEQVTGASLSLLSALVTRSLMRRTATGRFDLHELVRQYTAERLGENATEELAVRNEHMRYFVKLAETAAPELDGVQGAAWLARLERENDNLRAALQWALDHNEAEQALRLAGGLWQFWLTRGYVREGRDWLQQALNFRCHILDPAMADSSQLQNLKSLVAKALNAAGVLARAQSDYAQSLDLHQESLALLREQSDQVEIARTLNHLGNIAFHQGDYAHALTSLQESLALHQALENPAGMAQVLSDLGNVAYARGDCERARQMYEESLALNRGLANTTGVATALINLGAVALQQRDYGRATRLLEEVLAIERNLDDKTGIALALINLGDVARYQADYARARASFIESLQLLRELGDREGMAGALEGLVGVAVAQGQLDRAARLCGAAEALRDALHAPLSPAFRTHYDATLAGARAQLGDEPFMAALAEGRAMNFDQAIDAVLSDSDS